MILISLFPESVPCDQCSSNFMDVFSRHHDTPEEWLWSYPLMRTQTRQLK